MISGIIECAAPLWEASHDFQTRAHSRQIYILKDDIDPDFRRNVRIPVELSLGKARRAASLYKVYVW